jgi:hypothetical protein
LTGIASCFLQTQTIGSSQAGFIADDFDRSSSSFTLSTSQSTYPSIMADEKYGAEQREYANPPMQEKMSAGRYMATRVTTLKPAMAKVQNPIALLRLLNLQQWMFFLVAFFAWSWDAFDFFTVSLTVEDLAESFGKTKKGEFKKP